MAEGLEEQRALSPLGSPPSMRVNLLVKDPGPSPPNTPPAASTEALNERVFWVSPPALDPEEKLKYKDLPPNAFTTLAPDGEDQSPTEVLGEIRIGDDLFYWVVHENDIVYRHPVEEFCSLHHALVDIYNKHKEDGTLEKFHPNSSRIHPDDRVRMKISIPSKTSRISSGHTRTVHARAAKKDVVVIHTSDSEVDDSQSESYDGSDANDGGYDDQGRKAPEPTRRSSRAAAFTTKTSYRYSPSSPVKARTNPKRQTAAKGHDDDYDEGSEEEFDDSDGDEDPQPKTKKAVRGRLSRPAYGNIRLVADLSDEDSDDETAPLRAHRDTCEKCRQLPAHELLKTYYKRGTKRGKKSRRSTSDDFEDANDEEQRLLDLGGWIRWQCCLAAHWKCLAASQRDEIMKAARAKDKEAEVAGLMPRKRDTLGAYDTTEFICGGCIKGAMCMVCHEMAVKPEALPERKPAPDGEAQAQVNDTSKQENSSGTTPNKNAAPNGTPPPAIVVSSATPREDAEAATTGASSTGKLEPTKSSHATTPPLEEPRESVFRCITCKRVAHYAHLPQPISDDTLTPLQLAEYYQTENEWNCADCVSYIHPLDKIIAWRPYPANAVEDPLKPGELLNYKARLPREYFVKWVGRSYRRLQWVPHMWLLSTSAVKLKNFLSTGVKVQLLEAPVEDSKGKDKETLTATNESGKELTPSFLAVDEPSRASSAQPGSDEEEGPPGALPDAERRIPPAWRTVDRVLDIRLWDPAGRKRPKLAKKGASRKRKGKGRRIDSDDESEWEIEQDAEAEAERIAARERGEEPSEDLLETLEEWEARTGEAIRIDHAKLVIWSFIKWEDLSYEEATWDSPPDSSGEGYAAFERAFQRFLDSRSVFVVRKDKRAEREFDDRRRGMFEQKQFALQTDPDLGQEGKLMDFQLSGVNWLFRNWWRHQPSILADEMGLGKTVQMACVVGHLAEVFKAFPVLVVVPNSTITNWLREFAQWAPRLRVVPFSGDAKSREIIRDYELYHDSVPKGYTNLKFHVLVTTYETLIGKDFTPIFKSVPRWELLIVDEGQRLKSDSSLLFKRLNELHTSHRVLMTGTPLNNNIRELFNLMNFLDPDQWSDLPGLEKKYETLNEELLAELHETLKPYFLRRTKADVLKLPPKNEVIVPVSMTAIQKEVYRSILSQNAEILSSLTQDSSRVNKKAKISNLNNILMQLRKCLQHPYLVSRELEPTGPGLAQSEVHQNLLNASAKLRLLHSMLPKLKARGHRVLLFSQFVIGLDIIEDFLTGEGYKFLRLDGNTKQAQRQKDMDTFNRPDSDVFIFLLSTRAGGIGINLWSADTVIIFDPDFNPHQDLQAISRSHRYGQTKTVLVFKLMVKGAAEERIVQAGKKKLALDHLIVQKMDDDGAPDDVQSILTFGAKAVFEGSETHDINYTDADIDNLIARTEKEGDEVVEAAKSQLSFGFAKLWVVEKDTMEEIVEDAPADEQDDGFWGNVLARAAAEKAEAKAAEVTGRGAKRRAAVSQKYIYDEDGSPIKSKGKEKRRKSTNRKSTDGSDIEYNVSEAGSDASRSDPSSMLLPSEDEDLSQHPKPTNKPPLNSSTLVLNPIQGKVPLQYKPALTAIENRKRARDSPESADVRPCGLCQSSHGPGSCFMTQNPVNLVDYRTMLMTDSTEPIDLRRSAVQAIDQYLAARGFAHLIKSQPVALAGQADAEPPYKNKKHKSTHGDSLKRPASPDASSSVRKKAKSTEEKAIPCSICDGPFHLVKVCPVVKKGPESIRQAIARLENEPDTKHIVNILRSQLPTSESTPVDAPSSGTGLAR